ncbi:amidohydrolase [Citroniella saccharovorans]|uniref:5-methylthioadenosine/S-adenosylhomocysteine deaminase n=1 Tax=Citroniella saccharovorans TaxID=2053367 RepID=A0AAW9MQV8_9FIRM|nr:amidohydrolase [Citroniella saccharovorans]MEB3430028.1 amidohydrolase [Citroniella saccharovorans]
MILLKNIKAIPMIEENLIYENVNILIEGNRIVKISKDKIDAKDAYKIDGTCKLVIPGLINLHTHLGMSFFKNIADDLNLMDWLEKEIWPREAKLTPEDIELATKYSIMEAIKSGTSTLVDMYNPSSLIARSMEEMGVRGLVSYGVIDNEKPIDEKIEEIEEAFLEFKDSDLVTVNPGPHAVYTVSRESFIKLRDLALKLNTPLHIHLSETLSEVQNTIKEFSKTPVEYLDDMGIFNAKTIAAHCVHLEDKDFEILAKRNVSVAHNPCSNLKLASGIADVQKMLDMGINVGLGTDSSSSNNNLDMFEEMKFASLLAKVKSNSPTSLKAYKVLEMATVNGARAIGMENELGKIKEGFLADLAIIDLSGVNLNPLNNLISCLVYSANSSNVDSLIVNGKILLEGGKLKILGQDTLMNLANKRKEAYK